MKKTLLILLTTLLHLFTPTTQINPKHSSKATITTINSLKTLSQIPKMEESEIPLLDRFHLYKTLKQSHLKKTDIFILFYHSSCAHCKKFIPNFSKLIQKLSKEKFKPKFYRANCADYPHYIPAFQVTYFPFLVYFHKGIPYEKMAAPLSFSIPFTEIWIKETKEKFEKFDIKSKKVLAGSKIKNEEQLFRGYLRIVKAYLFAETREELQKNREILKGFSIVKGKKYSKVVPDKKKENFGVMPLNHT